MQAGDCFFQSRNQRYGRMHEGQARGLYNPNSMSYAFGVDLTPIYMAALDKQSSLLGFD